MAQKVLVVESVEVGTFALVGEFGRVADEVTEFVSPTVVVVLADTFEMVERVDEDVFFLRSLRELVKTLDGRNLVVETRSQQQGLVRKRFAVAELDFVVTSVDVLCSHVSFKLGPVINLGGDDCRFCKFMVNVSLRNAEIGRWIQEFVFP